MTLKIEIKMDNAAFEDEPFQEAGRILDRLTNQVLDGRLKIKDHPVTLYDINGNKVGKAEVVE